MAHQMLQEGALWPSVMIRFGPHWRNSKINGPILLMQYWILALNIIVLPILNMVGAIKNALAQQELDLSQFGAS